MAFESVKKVAEADFPTRWGAFRILGFEGKLPTQSGAANAGSPAQSGKVEGLVGFVRRNFMTPFPVAEKF